MKTGLLFLTHLDRPEIAERFERLNLPADWDAWILYDRQAIGEPLHFDRRRALPFTFGSLTRLGYRLNKWSKRHIGNMHIPAIWNARSLGWERTWVVEYDAVFGGDWAEFWPHFEDVPADLLSTSTRRQRCRRNYWWWDRGVHDKHGDPVGPLVTSQLQVTRYSNEAAYVLDLALRSKGIRGHQEVVVPTLANAAGLRIADFGADWYNEDNYRGSGPPIPYPPPQDSKLHHPVKLKVRHG